MRRIKYVGLVVAAVLMVLATVVGCAPKPAGKLTPIKIGMLAPFSGVGEYDSKLIENGVRAKLDEVGWEIAGRKIELITEDTAGDPVGGVDKAKKLVQVDKVDVVLGTLFSHVSLAVAKYLATTGTPQIAYSKIPIAMLAGKNGFLPLGTGVGNSDHLGSCVYNKLGYRTAAVIFDDYVAGEEYTEGFRKTFKESGGSIVQVQRSPLGTFDYSPYVATMKKADCVAFYLIPPECPPFYKQYTGAGLKMPLLYTDLSGWSDKDRTQIGDSCVGTVGQGIYSTLIDNDLNKKFVQTMKQKYGIYPSSYEYGGYLSTAVFLAAVKATKGDTTHEKIISALKKIKIDTPTGKLSFTDEGVGIGSKYILQVVKEGDRYPLKVLETYTKVVMKAPWE